MKFLSKMAEIALTSNQEDHYQRIDRNCQSQSIIQDESETGGGKTVVASVFARRKGIKKIIVFCNNSLHINHWNKHKVFYNLPIIDIITYDRLRGSNLIENINGRECLSHGLLWKLYDGRYEVTNLFKHYVEEGNLMIIVDESHSAKNDTSGRTEAVKTITKYLAIRNMTQPYPQNRSYVYFSSMTPFDENEHVINFAYMAGVIRSESLYDKVTGNLTGILELYEYCRFYDRITTDSIWGTFEVKPKNTPDVAYKLMTEVYLRLISSYIKDCHKNFISKQSIYFLYFTIEDLGVEMMKESLKMMKASPKIKSELSAGANRLLQDAIDITFRNTNLQAPSVQVTVEEQKYNLNEEFDRITLGANPKFNERSGVMYGTMTSQTIKTYFAVLGFVRKIFATVQNVKVVIFVNYKESIDILMRNLLDLNPVSITGDHLCTPEVRDDIIETFQENSSKINLLIIMSQLGSDCIQLDDIHGNRPRILLSFPSFYNPRYYQEPGRALRLYTKSNSLFFYIMIKSDECYEESLFRSIAKKTKVMKDTLRNPEIIYPDSYGHLNYDDSIDLNSMLKNAGMENPKTEIERIEKEIPLIKISRSSVSKTF